MKGPHTAKDKKPLEFSVSKDHQRIKDEFEIEVKNNIQHFRENIPELAPLPDAAVRKLYERYSTETACAGWLYVYADTPKFFREWMTHSPLDEMKEEFNVPK